jgi:hypothetical protein
LVCSGEAKEVRRHDDCDVRDHRALRRRPPKRLLTRA